MTRSWPPPLALFVLLVLAASVSSAEVLVFRDGTRLPIRQYEVRGRLVIFTGTEGSLRSLPAEYVDLAASDALNGNRPERGKAPPMPDTIGLRREAGSTSPPSPAIMAQPPDGADVRNVPPAPSVQDAWSLIGAAELLDPIADEASFEAEQLTIVWPDTDEQEGAFFRHSAKLAFATDSLRLAAAESFQRLAPESSLRSGGEFLRSSLWSRARELERRGRSPEVVSAFRAFGARLEDEPPSERRIRIAERLDEALGWSRMHVELRMAILAALVDGYGRLAPPDGAATERARESWIDRTRENLAENVRRAALTTVLFTYRSLSDEELLECLAFWESDSGRSLRHAAERSVLDSVRVGAARLQLLLDTGTRPTLGTR